MKPTLHIMCGPSYSGKSTVARWLHKNIDRSLIICPDTIREELSGDAGNQKVSGRAFRLAYERTHLALRSGYDVIFDATSLHQYDREKLYEIAKEEQSNAAVEFCVCDLAEAKERRKSRARVVSEDVVEHQFERFERPRSTESDALDYIRYWRSDNISEILKEMGV